MKANQSYELIQKELSQLSSRYHRLLLVCGEGRDVVLKAIAAEREIPTVNLNLELSEALLEIPLNKRRRRVGELVEKILASYDHELVYLNHIELLFHPSLMQNPLRLLEKISRNRSIILSWPGELKNNSLIYAKPSHAEYCSFPASGVNTIEVTG